MTKTSKTLFSRVILLIAVVSMLIGTALCITSCNNNTYTPPTKAELISNVEESSDSTPYGYVLQYLQIWDFPNFDATKFAWAEVAFQQYYAYGDGLPATYEHAKLVANYFIKNYYDLIELTNKKAVTDALIASYVSTVGDPYAVYRIADEYSSFQDELSGTFGGIGVVVEYDHQEETIMVSSVNMSSPAESAGMLPGDYIIAVDGVSIEELGYLYAVYYIRGEVGTQVTVTVMRGDEQIDILCTRAKVEDQSVTYEIIENVGYVRVSEFKANTTAQFIEAIDYMKAEEVEGIIFDMRTNPGGLVSTACDMISYLVPNGHTIISYDLKGEDKDEVKISKDTTHPITGEKSDHVLDLPLVVLCNEYTASSAEIFTSAIRDYDELGIVDAVIVGKTTYKKGVMQTTFEYTRDSSALTFTTAYYNPPSGVNYHGIGITPDVIVDNTETEDLQLEEAINQLKALINEN